MLDTKVCFLKSIPFKYTQFSENKLAVKAKGLEGLAHLIYHFMKFVWLNFSDQSPDHKLPKEGLKIKYLTIFNNFNIIIGSVPFAAIC